MPFFTSDHYCQTLDILTTLSPFTGNKITLAEFCYNYTREFEDFLSNLTQMSNTPGFKIISLLNQRMVVFFFFLKYIYSQVESKNVNSHLLVHSIKWLCMNPAPGTQSRSPMWVAGRQLLELPLLFPGSSEAKSWSQKPELAL